VYTVLICNLPLLLYLQLNPMFIFKRYFLPVLPFCLLTLACGIEWIARACRLRGPAKAVFFLCAVCAIVWLQWPSIRTITTQSRQHYREAAAWVESRSEADFVVFVIGHAGSHFGYYANVPVVVPETFDDFRARMHSASEAWCLITAWLPEVRPAHEPDLLYTEDPEHQRIYDYVIRNFTLEKRFSGVFQTYVYRRPAEKGGAGR
jgi:hypothetical protein